jgi:DNA-binding response OmpR family regulator
MTARILLVEDEPAILESLAYVLGRDGFAVVAAKSAAEAQALADGVDLVVLDLMLPDGSGFDLIRGWRAGARPMPIIVLSSRDAEADRVAALESGADDYVTKPFSPREIVARVRAVLRRSAGRSQPGPDSSERPEPKAPPLSTDPRTRRALCAGRALDLTRVEFDLLATLLASPGRVFTRAELIDRVWGDGFRITDRTIDSHVKALRKKISEAGADASWIETVRGVGYRLSDDPSSAEPA